MDDSKETVFPGYDRAAVQMILRRYDSDHKLQPAKTPAWSQGGEPEILAERLLAFDSC